MIKSLFVCSFVCFFLFIGSYRQVFAQTFDFKSFDSDVGLPQNFVYSLVQDYDGYIWIGTGEGLARYDGSNLKSFSVNDSLASDFVNSLYVDKDSILWIGHNNGSLSYYDGEFHKIIVGDGTYGPVKDICEDKNGNVWATMQNKGLVRISKDKKVSTYTDKAIFGGKLFYSIESIDSFHFIIGTSDGLFVLRMDDNLNPRTLQEVSSIPPTGINAIVKRKLIDNEFWIATEDEGFYLFKYNDNTSEHFVNNNLCMKFNIEEDNIVDIYEDVSGDLLLASWGNGITRLEWDDASQTFNKAFNFSTKNGLSHNFVKAILADRENNYWFATYGGGVSVLLCDYFVHYDLDDIGFKQNKAVSVLANHNNLWIGLERGLLKTDPYCFADHEYYDHVLGIPNDRITGFEYDSTGVIWVSSLSEGLYFRTPGELKFKRFNYTKSVIGNRINDMAISGDKLYLATTGGFYTINTKTKSVDRLSTERGLPHNSINFVYLDRFKNIWIGPKSSGICKVDSANIEVHKLSKAPINVSGMTEDSEGNFWLSTIGKGVLKYTKDTLMSVTVTDGLSKNYCYDITCDKKNRLWVCHWPGVSCIDLKTMKIRKFGFDDKMGGDFYKVWNDSDDNIWFASSTGVIKYFPDKDKKNTVPPLINFSEILISGKSYSADKPIVLDYPYKNKYAFRFAFTGISFKNPKEVTYQYKMLRNGEDSKEWKELGNTNFREYEFLPNGDYKFTVRALNADGVPSLKAVSLQITIKAPFWKSFWFYLLLVVFIGGFIFVVIRYRERRLQMQKERLQKEVDYQTIVLRQQKAEIERKNHDITASINYAKRIQKSILPQIETLKSTFPESFIFFAPRDIVSGDFYWFNKSKGIFTICCADCTGHGVPGAFMSMIGTTLLNDISKDVSLLAPADMLERLDNDIRILLQSQGADQAKDGMDISVIQVDINDNKVVLASAKRPVFLYINKELVIYNGTRRSIGDDDLAKGSSFMNYEYECSEGDCIYLFSDGYPDQFGGPRGKKMMKVGVKEVLDEIHNKPMQEQGDLIRDHFTKWKGDFDQIDDVLFMGIRL